MSSQKSSRSLSLIGIAVSICFILLAFGTVWNTLINAFKELFDHSSSFQAGCTSLTGAFLAVIMLVAGILGVLPHPNRRAIRILAIIVFILSAAYFILGLVQQTPSRHFPFITIPTTMLVQAILAFVLYKEA